MYQMTRFSRPILKSGRLLTIALLALASFGAPPVSAQICCFKPDYRPHTAPSNVTYFNINGRTYPVDSSAFVWGQNPYGPWMVVGHIVGTPNGYIATMYAGGRYRAFPVNAR